MSVRIHITIVWLCLSLLAANQVMAAGPAGIEGTAHDFSHDGTWGWESYESGGAPFTEVCVFCHTPHGGSANGPLWNRPVSQGATDLTAAGYFTHYNSSTLTSGAAGTPGYNTARQLGPESILCMTCHDGSIAVDRVINESNIHGHAYPGGQYNATIMGDIFGIAFNPMRVGGSPSTWEGTGDLTDDHPVSFSYIAAEQEETLSGSGGLTIYNVAEAGGVRFFGPTKRVECSTCHDPHVDYITNTEYSPFLITSNRGSKLCLACHIK